MFCLKNFSKYQKNRLREEATDGHITWNILFLSLLKVLSKIAAQEIPLGKILNSLSSSFSMEQCTYSLVKVFFFSKPFQDSLTKKLQEILPEADRVVLSAKQASPIYQYIEVVVESSRPFSIKEGSYITPFPFSQRSLRNDFEKINLDNKIYQILLVLDIDLLTRIVVNDLLEQVTNEYWGTDENDDFRFHALLKNSSDYIADYLSQYFYIDRCHFEIFT